MDLIEKMKSEKCFKILADDKVENIDYTKLSHPNYETLFKDDNIVLKRKTSWLDDTTVRSLYRLKW